MNPSLLLIPDRYKKDKLYSQIPDSGDGDLTFARNSNATRVNSAGLIEKVRTNLLTYSNTFSDAAWTKVNSTETSGQTGYDGTNNAWLLTATTGGGYITQSIVDSGMITISVYAKAGTLNWLRITEFSGANAWFDLANGVVGATFSGSNAISRSIESVGGGWYRCSMTTVAGGNSFRLYPSTANNSEASAGDIVIQAAQREQGDIATPYIPTTTAAVSVGITADIPRLDYTGGGCPSLLLEPQRTNLSTDSETFAASTGTTISLNNAASPDGYVNADKLVEDTSTGVHQTSWATFLGGSVDSSAYCVSVFVKAAGRSRILFFENNQDIGGATTFDLSSGTIVSGGGKIENYGSGWYRCTIFPIKNFSTASNARIQLISTGTTTSYAGDGTSGIFLWGKQVEAGAYPTSYIPTLGSSVTRLADAASKTGISSLIGQTEGTVFVEGEAVTIDTAANSPIYITVSDGNQTDICYIQQRSDGTIRADYLSGAVVQARITSTTTYPLGTKIKAALGYKSGDFVLYINGVQIGTDVGTSMAPLSKVTIGAFEVAGFTGSAISQAALFKTRLTNAQLAELTSL